MERIALIVGSLLFFIFVEYLFPNYLKHRNPFTRKFFFDDMLFLILSSVIGLVMPVILFYYLEIFRAEFQVFRLTDAFADWSWTAQFLAAFIVKDFLGYFMHRIAHWGVFWNFHKVHHESDYIDASMAFRVHPMNLIFISVRTPGLVLLGFDASVLPMSSLIQFVHNIFIHTNIRLDFGLLNYLFISPYLHRIHHAATPSLHHKNYGVYLSVWDQLFGTFVNEKNLSFELGVEGHRRQNFFLTNALPFFSQKWQNKIIRIFNRPEANDQKHSARI
jgi:sterol desaturase/sphingolipid hydroxylase (fatty acid hydroxylase superfamily)